MEIWNVVEFFTIRYYPKLLDLVSNGKQFAAYMPVYPGCDVVFKEPKIVNKPMLMLHSKGISPTVSLCSNKIDCINYVKKCFKTIIVKKLKLNYDLKILGKWCSVMELLKFI